MKGPHDIMADLPAAEPQQQFAPFHLYRWWHRKFVDNVDHEGVIARIVEDSGWSARYIFMTMMSAGIAVLGLLLSSPAVVIGAMLISPLMNPILGLGFSLTLFNFAEMRRSLVALASGSVIAVAFTASIVLLSPLKAPTAEILARTRPNLFDLLIAMLAALAGTFAIIRGKGETITGVAIATALMPPLAVLGYGLATWNMPVLGGSFALFVTNFVTIALSATVMARLFGFGYRLTPRQGRLQTIALLVVFLVMAIPLGFSLARIAREAVTVSQLRAALSERFGSKARVTQLDVDFSAEPIDVRSVVIAPRDRAAKTAAVRALLEKKLGRPLTLQLDQVLLSPGSSALDAQRIEFERAKAAENAAAEHDRAIAQLVGLMAGVGPDQVTMDREHQRAQTNAAALPGADLATYFALEQRASRAADGWDVIIVPPLQPLPEIAFANNADTLDDAASKEVLASAWAARRWNVPALRVPGLTASTPPSHPSLAQRRALAIKTLLSQQGIASVPAPPAGQRFRLSAGAP